MVRIYLLAAQSALVSRRHTVAYNMLKLALGHANRTKDARKGKIMSAINAVRARCATR